MKRRGQFLLLSLIIFSVLFAQSASAETVPQAFLDNWRADQYSVIFDYSLSNKGFSNGLQSQRLCANATILDPNGKASSFWRVQGGDEISFTITNSCVAKLVIVKWDDKLAAFQAQGDAKGAFAGFPIFNGQKFIGFTDGRYSLAAPGGGVSSIYEPLCSSPIILNRQGQAIQLEALPKSFLFDGTITGGCMQKIAVSFDDSDTKAATTPRTTIPTPQPTAIASNKDSLQSPLILLLVASIILLAVVVAMRWRKNSAAPTHEFTTAPPGSNTESYKPGLLFLLVLIIVAVRLIYYLAVRQ